jgi:hypothetical protein
MGLIRTQKKSWRAYSAIGTAKTSPQTGQTPSSSSQLQEGRLGVFYCRTPLADKFVGTCNTRGDDKPAEVLANEEEFGRAIALRNSDCSKSDEYAPLDHYWDARRATSESGLWGGGLSFGISAPIRELLAGPARYFGAGEAGMCSVSPPSFESLGAFYKGIADGLTDYRTIQARERERMTPDRVREMLDRGEPVRTDKLDKQTRDYLDGKQWA